MMERRTAIAGLLGLSACGLARPHGTDFLLADQPPQGRTLVSQSVMLSAANTAGTHFAAIRLCQYPDAGVTWLWCNVLTPKGFYQFASNRLPWAGPTLSGPKASGAQYRAAGVTGRLAAEAVVEREGTLASPTAVTLNAGFDSDTGLGAVPGRVQLTATFAPHAEFAGLLPGRTEAFGHARFALLIDGKTLVFEGPGQFHEQAQTEARFTTPFVFASLWSENAFSTLLESPTGSGGYVIDSGRPRPLLAPQFDLSPRALSFTYKNGGIERVSGLAVIHSYAVPIYGQLWRGRFVRGAVFGRQMVGMVNAWQKPSAPTAAVPFWGLPT